MSTYGDRGNLLVLTRRAQLRGIPVEQVLVQADQAVPREGDIYLMGGGEDLPQELAARRLRADGGLTAVAGRGAVVFGVCAGYQLLGSEFAGGVPRLTGFENHGGVSVLGAGVAPLARVLTGIGNGDGTEGAFAGRVLGTYLHGPVLVRNPGLADLLLSWASGPLPPLNPAHESWVRQLRDQRLAAIAG
jgi:CobQ-like glutamine amidotransferase family enzyme